MAISDRPGGAPSTLNYPPSGGEAAEYGLDGGPRHRTQSPRMRDNSAPYASQMETCK